jgi:hypothetical protein
MNDQGRSETSPWLAATELPYSLVNRYCLPSFSPCGLRSIDYCHRDPMPCYWLADHHAEQGHECLTGRLTHVSRVVVSTVSSCCPAQPTAHARCLNYRPYGALHCSAGSCSCCCCCAEGWVTSQTKGRRSTSSLLGGGFRDWTIQPCRSELCLSYCL